MNQSASFFSPPAGAAGLAWLSAGEADTEGGDAGFSDSMLARALFSR